MNQNYLTRICKIRPQGIISLKKQNNCIMVIKMHCRVYLMPSFSFCLSNFVIFYPQKSSLVSKVSSVVSDFLFQSGKCKLHLLNIISPLFCSQLFYFKCWKSNNQHFQALSPWHSAQKMKKVKVVVTKKKFLIMC